MRITVFFLLLSSMSYGQGWYPSGARSMSMGNASSTLNDVWAFQNNPGALGLIENFSVGVSYENRFLLKELQTQSLACAIPLKVGVISFGGHMYGYRQFRSYKGGLGYSMNLAEKLSAGVQLNYQGIQLEEYYGSKNTITAEVGILASISEKWNVSAAVFNLGRAKLSEFEDDRFTTMMRLGSAYQFSDKFLWAVEVEKDLDYPARFKSGIEYTVVDNFTLRGGFSTAPIEYSFGFGYEFKGFRIDLGSGFHQILGWSPHVSFVYSGDKK